MPYLSEILSDVDLAAALTNLADVCAAHQAELNLTLDDVAEIQGAADSFTTDLNAAVAAKAAARSAVEAKNITRQRSREIAAKWSRIFRSNESIPDSLLVNMRMAPHVVPGTRTTPNAPSSFTASVNGEGSVLLKWHRAGNRQGTQFVIEVQYEPGARWTILDITTQCKYRARFEPGRYVAFRVKARRGGRVSEISQPCTLWYSGSAQLPSAA